MIWKAWATVCWKCGWGICLGTWPPMNLLRVAGQAKLWSGCQKPVIGSGESLLRLVISPLFWWNGLTTARLCMLYKCLLMDIFKISLLWSVPPFLGPKGRAMRGFRSKRWQPALARRKSREWNQKSKYYLHEIPDFISDYFNKICVLEWAGGGVLLLAFFVVLVSSVWQVAVAVWEFCGGFLGVGNMCFFSKAVQRKRFFCFFLAEKKVWLPARIKRKEKRMNKIR